MNDGVACVDACTICFIRNEPFLLLFWFSCLPQIVLVRRTTTVVLRTDLTWPDLDRQYNVLGSLRENITYPLPLNHEKVKGAQLTTACVTTTKSSCWSPRQISSSVTANLSLRFKFTLWCFWTWQLSGKHTRRQTLNETSILRQSQRASQILANQNAVVHNVNSVLARPCVLLAHIAPNLFESIHHHP